MTGQTITYTAVQVSFIVIFKDSQFLICSRPNSLFAPQNSGPDSTVTSIMKHFSITSWTYSRPILAVHGLQILWRGGKSESLSLELVLRELLWSVRQVPSLAMRPKNWKRVRTAEPSSDNDEALNIILSQHAACHKKEQAWEQERESEYIEDSMDVCSAFPFFFLFSLAWQFEDHSTPPLVEHTSDGDTSSDDNDSRRGNSRTEGTKCNSSTSTSSGKNSSSDCISAPSHQSSSSNKVQSGRILGDKGSSGNQCSQGRGANLDITHSDDVLHSPPPRKQGTHGHAAKGTKQS